MKNIILITGLFLGLIYKSHAGIVEISPISYSFDKTTDSASYDYSDWGGNQLTDGQYGVAPWSANLGNGPAYEWVGWDHESIVNIDFDFGTTTNISKINIGSVQDDIYDVVLPSIELFSSQNGIDWVSFSILNIPESSANNDQYFTYKFNGLSLSTL